MLSTPAELLKTEFERRMNQLVPIQAGITITSSRPDGVRVSDMVEVRLNARAELMVTIEANGVAKTILSEAGKAFHVADGAAVVRMNSAEELSVTSVYNTFKLSVRRKPGHKRRPDLAQLSVNLTSHAPAGQRWDGLLGQDYDQPVEAELQKKYSHPLPLPKFITGSIEDFEIECVRSTCFKGLVAEQPWETQCL